MIFLDFSDFPWFHDFQRFSLILWFSAIFFDFPWFHDSQWCSLISIDFMIFSDFPWFNVFPWFSLISWFYVIFVAFPWFQWFRKFHDRPWFSRWFHMFFDFSDFPWFHGFHWPCSGPCNLTLEPWVPGNRDPIYPWGRGEGGHWPWTLAHIYLEGGGARIPYIRRSGANIGAIPPPPKKYL